MATDFVGKTFGSYKLVAQLGRGGMASVYRGYQESIDRSVAVKVLPPEYLHDPNFAERFVAEARMLAKLTHPSILPLYDFGTANDVPYIVMPLMAHGTLADRLARGPMPLAEVLRIIQPIASALDYAHKQGIIHRDLKPSNILFDQNDLPFLGDFGIAKALESTSGLTGTGIIGTPAYMSPEQAQGERIDSRSDIYALGVVVYQLLTGQQLFRATTPMGIVRKHLTETPPLVRLTRPDIPEGADKVVQKALAKRPDDRYQTASEFVAALSAAAGQPTSTASGYASQSDEMRTMLKPAVPLELPSSQPRPLTPPPGAARPPTPGTPLPPYTPPPSGAGRPPTPGTPVAPYTPPPSGTSRPLTPGTPMPTPYPPQTGGYPLTPGTPAPPYTQTPQPAPRRGGISGFLLGSGVGIAVGVGVLLLLIGACCAGIYGLYVYGMSLTPTATVAARPTFEATPTDTPPAALPSGVLLADDFSDPQSGWEVSNDASSVLGYVDGEYSIKALETHWFTWSNPRRASYSNMRAEVEGTEAARTSDILFGLICDFQDNQHYYYAGVDTTGNYAIGKNDGGTFTYLSNAGQIQNSPAMARGGNYKLAVECGQGVIALYVDGVLIDTVEDTAYSDGNIGLFLDVFNPDGSDTHNPKEVEVRFDNVNVTAMPETPPTPRPATDTPEAAPTARRTGLATATPLPAAGENWIADSFDANQYTWATGADDGDYATINREIANGKYHWTVKSKKGVLAREAPNASPAADFIAAVEAQRTGTGNGRVGLSFREDKNSNYYYFGVSDTEQMYGVFLYYNKEWKTLIDNTKSTAIRTDQPNWIAVKAEGNHFSFYINNQLVNEVDDTQLSEAGWVGLTAEMFDKDASADFEFDNFRLGPPAMLTFLDGFSKDTGTWGTKSDADVKRAYKDGQYHITVIKPNTLGWSNLGKDYKDFEVELEATQVEGPDNNSYGVLVRYVDGDNYYRFIISGDGAYSFDKQKKNEWVTLIDWTKSSAINKGQATNVIRVVCKGDTFTFFVNDVRLGDYTDSDFASGDLALTVGKYDDVASAHISFDNVRVWEVK